MPSREQVKLTEDEIYKMMKKKQMLHDLGVKETFV